MMDSSEHIGMEKELKRERKFLQNIMATIPSALLVLDKHLTIKSANLSFYRLFQVEPKRTIGSKLADVLEDKDGKLNTKLAQLLGTEDLLENYELRYQSEKLGERILNITALGVVVAEEEEEEEELVVIQDITKQRKAEYNLAERVKELGCLYGITNISERPGLTLDEIYQEVVEVLPQSWQYPEIACAQITIDGKRFKTKNYRHTQWNQSTDIKIYGAKAGVIEVCYLKERPELAEGPFLREERLLLDAAAERLGRITERKQTEEALKASESKVRSMLAAMVDLVFTLDKEGRFTAFYAPNEELYTSPEEVVGKRYSDVMPSHVTKLIDDAFGKSKKRDTSEFEYSLEIGDETKWYSAKLSSLLVDGDFEGVVAVSRDITERKKMQEQLMVRDRLASIGELVSGVAHELNNPLTSVIGFSDLLVGKKDLPDDIKEDIKLVNREAQRTATIVKNLLTFARKQPKEKQLTDINKAIEAVVELRDYEQKVRSIEVNTRFDSDLPEIIANAFDLQQVFLNIIVNAEHAMLEAHGKGTINITTEREGDIIRVSLTDDGPGISEEHIGHVFDPFFTTKEVGKGTGLGLSVCYGTITDHGGRIYVESEPGKGATFIIELPVVTTDNEGTKNENS